MPPAMLYLLAKSLEVSGLLTLIWALYLGLAGYGLFSEVILLAAGAAVFYLGRAIEQRAGGGAAGPGR